MVHGIEDLRDVLIAAPGGNALHERILAVPRWRRAPQRNADARRPVWPPEKHHLGQAPASCRVVWLRLPGAELLRDLHCPVEVLVVDDGAQQARH